MIRSPSAEQIPRPIYTEEMKLARKWLARNGGAATPSGTAGPVGGARIRFPEGGYR